ncbi:patatin-like phospholipase family protein [Actinomadura scrupuli]|uniref:patatin-like phospholipase family protein n=1 Tax=Actinomadura scrupuli TaxID=559629 RepID=UPI003D95B912
MSGRNVADEVPGSAGRTVVLGPGGLVGTAWLAGLAAGLRHAGVDLGAADLIIGTSAGAIVGAALATGRDLDRLAILPARPGGPARRADPGQQAAVFAVLGDAGLDPVERLRRAGRLAVAAETISEQRYIAQMEYLIGAHRWPSRRLLVPAVDIETGEPVIWDRAGEAPLPAAVASSTAFPGAAPPITVNGRRYMDGALRAGANLDLAEGARVLVVLEPGAHMFGLAGEASGDTAGPGGHPVVRIVPDPAAVEVFGPDLGDRSVWPAAYQAGRRQAAEAAGRARAAWRSAHR